MKNLSLFLLLFCGLYVQAKTPVNDSVGNQYGILVRTGDESYVVASVDCSDPITWDAAVEYCKNFRGGGHSDWVMPNKQELPTIAEIRNVSQNNWVGNWQHWSARLWSSDYDPRLGYGGWYQNYKWTYYLINRQTGYMAKTLKFNVIPIRRVR